MSVTTPATAPAAAATAVDEAGHLLRCVQQAVAEHFGADQPLTQAVLHLIGCAADALDLLSQRDCEAAHQMLGCARAAVTAATYAARRADEQTRTAQP